jgi:hypothetical protein
MHIHTSHRSAANSGDVRQLTSQERESLLRLAKQWRQEWRAEVAVRARVTPSEHKNGKSHSATFAAAIAKAEFGRFYWDARRKPAREPSRRKREKRRR